tara:strand:- start:117822 stop:118190 length:369 start_codon:yes stop_codon:yes gene_type:complete
MKYVSCALVLSVALVFGISSSGCNQSALNDAADASVQPATATPVVNQFCPIMGGTVSEEGGTVEWNSKAIGFCCGGCDAKWQALSDEGKAEKLAAALAKSEGDSNHDVHQQEGHQHDDLGNS